MRKLAIAIVLASNLALAADPSYVVVGRAVTAAEGESSADMIASIAALLARQTPPIVVARAREGIVVRDTGAQCYVGITVPFDALDRVLALGFEPVPQDFLTPTRQVH